MFVIGYTNMWPNFILVVHRIQKNKQKCSFHFAAMSMMTSQILQENQNIFRTKHYFIFKEIFFKLHIKDYFMAEKNDFVAEVTFNKYYRIIKKSVHASQFYINHQSHLDVWLVSDQGPLVLELNVTIKLHGTLIWT